MMLVYHYCRLTETISTIKKKLNEAQLHRFRDSIFGKFLEIEELYFNWRVVHHMLKKCVNEENFEFDFGSSGSKVFSLEQFELITGLPCGSVPTREVVHSSRIADTYFQGGRKIKKSELSGFFENSECNDDDPADNDRVKLALLLFLETVILSKDNNCHVPIKHMEMVDDLEYFNLFPWGKESFTSTVDSLRLVLGKLWSNSYTHVGFPLAFMIWGYENIPPLALARQRSEESPLIVNWKIPKNSGHEQLVNNFLGGTDGDMPRQDRATAYTGGGQKNKRKHDQVASNAGKRARRAASTSQQLSSSSSSSSSSMDGDKFSHLEGEIVGLRREMVGLRHENVGLRHQITSMESKITSTESKITSMESKIDLMMSFLLGQSQPGVQDNDNLRQRGDDSTRGQDDSHMPEEGLRGFDDGTIGMGAGVGTSYNGDGDGDGNGTTGADLGGDATHSSIPTEDVRGDGPPSSLSPLLWPPDGNLTLEWIQNLMQTLEQSSRILTPSDFSSVLPLEVFNSLVQRASNILKDEPNCLRIDPLKSSVVVAGDIHGQLHDLLYILRHAGFTSQDRIFIFNGDFVDRGAWGLETFVIPLACKVYLPHKVYLHQGNHESDYCTSRYGFEKEVLEKYGKEGSNVYQSCIACFKNLPLASVVAGQVFIAHGGLFRSSPCARKTKKGKRRSSSLTLGCVDDLIKVRRDRSDVILEDILWSDPTMEQGLKLNKHRNIGLLWGPDCTEKFLSKNNLKLIIRSHESPYDRRNEPSKLTTMDEGYSIDHEVASGKLITFCSAPDYPQFQRTKHRHKDKGSYIILESPNFEEPHFHSFEAVPRPQANPFYASGDGE